MIRTVYPSNITASHILGVEITSLIRLDFFFFSLRLQKLLHLLLYEWNADWSSQNTSSQTSHLGHCRKPSFWVKARLNVSTLRFSSGQWMVGGGGFSTLVIKFHSPADCLNHLILCKEDNFTALSGYHPFRFLCHNRCLWHSDCNYRDLIYASDSAVQGVRDARFILRKSSGLLPSISTNCVPGATWMINKRHIIAMPRSTLWNQISEPCFKLRL